MKRKIIKIDEDSYMSLKQIKYEDGWEKQGREYSRKGLVNLLERDRCEFIFSDEIKEEVEDYIRLCSYRKYMFENRHI